MHTRCRIFSSKGSKKRSAAGLRPDPLGEIRRSPVPLAAETGKGKGRGTGREREVRERKGGGRETEGHIMSPPLFSCKVAPTDLPSDNLAYWVDQCSVRISKATRALSNRVRYASISSYSSLKAASSKAVILADLLLILLYSFCITTTTLISI